MRISDWSSDVCSSDLEATPDYEAMAAAMIRENLGPSGPPEGLTIEHVRIMVREQLKSRDQLVAPNQRRIWGIDRKSVVSGKSVSVRVDLGGPRIINNKQHTH